MCLTTPAQSRRPIRPGGQKQRLFRWNSAPVTPAFPSLSHISQIHGYGKLPNLAMAQNSSIGCLRTNGILGDSSFRTSTIEEISAYVFHEMGQESSVSHWLVEIC